MKKGFTLIELLAVIVILAVIALIAVPIAINVIKDSKESASKISLKNYIHAVNTAISNANLSTDISDATCTVLSNGDLNCGGVLVTVNTKNVKNASGTIVIKNYEVSEYTGLVLGGKTYNTVAFNGTLVNATSSDTHKGIVYMDPTDLSTTCNALLASQNLNDEEALTGIKSGCMKFYIFDDSGSTYKMILDHNTSGDVAWCSNTDYTDASGIIVTHVPNNYGPITVTVKLQEDTDGWVGNPRLITANEVAHIVGADTAFGFNSSTGDWGGWFYLDGIGSTSAEWQVQVANSSNKSRYAWLFDNTGYCEEYGCNIEDNNEYLLEGNYGEYYDAAWGYWTSTPSFSFSYGAFSVTTDGRLGILMDDSVGDVMFGVRPVIELSKNIFE